MERRCEVRVSLDQMICVTVLGANSFPMQGTAADLSGRGIRIVVPARIAVGDPLRIDFEDVLLLGEVCYCQPYGRDFMIGVQLDQALNGLAALARLNGALLQDRSESARDAGELSYSISEQT